MKVFLSSFPSCSVQFEGDVALNFWCKRNIRVRVCAASSCRTFKDAVPISRKRVKSGDEAAVEHHAASELTCRETLQSPITAGGVEDESRAD